jgi:hypothetical protein
VALSKDFVRHTASGFEITSEPAPLLAKTKTNVRTKAQQAAAGKVPSKPPKAVKARRGGKASSSSCDTDLSSLGLTLSSIDLTGQDAQDASPHLTVVFVPCPKCCVGSLKSAGHVGRHARRPSTTTTTNPKN